MKEYRTPAALKTAARVHMFGRYGVTVRAYIWMNAILLIMTWLFASMNTQGAGSLISLYIFYAIRFIILGIFMSGTAFLYLNIASEQPAYPGMVFYGFRNNTDKAVLISLVIDLIQMVLCIPMLVFFILFRSDGDVSYIIPMAIGAGVALAGLLVTKALFLPAYYLIHDFPDYGFSQIIRLCPTIMRGHMGRALYMYISFVPMMLLEVLSLGAAAPWVESYINASVTEMYLDLMRK
ncbi:MAG: DUF975 family protein [Lachnospiraceae bacterium]|nr:DUF975 family protein [Lachnospiraceae bacterium]